ncbi:MAG: hypothetical protein QUT30_03665, partial [Acidobacteriota bacterium]|nr:hypothetical protein [Acidobacteriota bacterium]
SSAGDWQRAKSSDSCEIIKAPPGFAPAQMYPMPDSCFIGADPAHHDGFCRQEFSAVRDCDGVVLIKSACCSEEPEP